MIETTQDEGAARRIDEVLGERIRRYRRARGMSQMVLAEAIGISYQQVQKYERGTNRLSVARLTQISAAIEVPAADLIAGLDAAYPERGMYLGAAAYADLLTAFVRVRSDLARRCIVDLVREIAAGAVPQDVQSPADAPQEVLSAAVDRGPPSDCPRQASDRRRRVDRGRVK